MLRTLEKDTDLFHRLFENVSGENPYSSYIIVTFYDFTVMWHLYRTVQTTSEKLQNCM